MEWINVKNQLPKDYEFVLWFDDRDENMHVDYFVPSQSKMPDYVTYWMKLPEKPIKK